MDNGLLDKAARMAAAAWAPLSVDDLQEDVRVATLMAEKLVELGYEGTASAGRFMAYMGAAKRGFKREGHVNTRWNRVPQEAIDIALVLKELVLEELGIDPMDRNWVRWRANRY